jgi:hypothetical protein
MPSVPAPSSFSSGLYFAKPDPSGKLALHHDGEPVAGLALLPASGFSLAETVVVSFEPGADAYSSKLVVASPDAKMRRVIDLPNTYKPQHPALSPDGTQVAFDAKSVSNGTISQLSKVFVVDLDLHTAKVVSQGGDAVAPVWFPITRRILYVSGDGATGARDLVIVDPKDPVSYTSTSMGGDGAHVAISADEGEILIPATGQTLSSRFAPRSSIAAAVKSGASAAGMTGFATITAAYAKAGGSIYLAGNVPGKGIVVAEVDRLGGGFKVLSGPFSMATQTAAMASFLPVYLTDFP